jgi:Flp pilus assembly protein TadD
MLPSRFSPFAARSKRAVLVSTALTLLLSSCASSGSLFESLRTGATARSAPAADADPATLAEYWGGRYQTNEKNREVALNYANALRQSGNADQAVAVLQKAVINFPEDREILASYGKAQAAAGQLVVALDAVQRAQTPDKPDWKLLSTEASIRDQMGDTVSARKLHARASAAVPDDATILSNYGMSYVLTGELPQAESLLKKANALPGGDARVRQNLALVVGLQGRFTEAQKIAGADLPPAEAAANVAYLKKMLAQQNTWQTLQSGGKPAPAGSPPKPTAVAKSG